MKFDVQKKFIEDRGSESKITERRDRDPDKRQRAEKKNRHGSGAFDGTRCRVDISRCYQILDLPADATMKELKEAYRDAISVWHPDRFSANPRLKLKAEKKAAQINDAYEIIAAHIAGRNGGVRQEMGPDRSQSGGGRVERAAETGTRVALHVGYAVYSAIRRLTSSK